MQNNECMGCQTYFKENKSYKLENLITEYKNFQLPLKDDKSKVTLLKTIVSFLNSQGGTIYIGIEDKQGSVQGVQLQRKQMDNFMLLVKDLIQRIRPKVFLNNKQEVKVQFVPVKKQGDFTGKYVVKIVVQQGDPSHVYYFSKKVKLEGANSKIDEFQIFIGYQRHNMGGITKIQGNDLLQLIHEKALKPNQAKHIFHQGCNPQPPYLQVQIRRIYFSNCSREYLKIFENSFSEYFQKQNINYQKDYIRNEQAILLTLEDQDDFKLVQDYILDNIKYLNNQVFKEQNVNFQPKGIRKNYFLLQNNPKKNIQKQQKSAKKEQSQSKKMNKFNYKSKEEIQKPFQISPKVQEIEKKFENVSKSFTKRFGISFTHIEPRSIDQLQQFLTSSICKKYQKHFVKYVNTIQLFLGNHEQQTGFLNALNSKISQLEGYGFKGEIKFGRNKGSLRICNYDKNRWELLAVKLQNLAGDQIKDIFVQQDEKNRFSIIAKFKQKSNACIWLDKILKNRLLSEFSIPGSDNRNKKIMKLKVYLDLQ